MISSIKSLLFSDTGRDTSIVLITTAVNGLIGGLFFIFAPRILGPADYGLFSTVILTAVLVSTIANFGIDSGILKFATKESPIFNKILSLAFKSYIIFGLTAAIVGLITSPAIASLLSSSQIAPFLRIGFLGIIFILLTNFFVAALQAKGDFYKASLINIIGNVARIVVLLVAVNFLKLGLLELTVIFFFAPIFSVAAGFFFSPVKLQKVDKEITVKFFKFNAWLAAALIISTIPFDNYLLLKMSGATETGIYFAPFKILTFAYMFGGNFTRVLAQRFSSFDTNVKAREYAKKALPIPLLFASALLVSTFFSEFITGLIFGNGFEGSAQVYRILCYGFIFFFLATIPSTIIIYYKGKSKISFFVTVAKYAVFISLLLILVPTHKANGAALAFSFSEAFALIIMSTYLIVKLQNDKTAKLR